MIRVGVAFALFALIAAVLGGCSSCPKAPTSAEPVVPMTGGDSDETRAIVAAAEQFANTTCECTTPSCADGATNEFVDWLRAHPQRSGSPVAAKRVLVAMEKMLFCRDKLSYPTEPVDLDRS